MESFHSVIVIGAGASGLYTAQLLKSRCPDVLVVEATDRIGGRIKQVHGLAPWAIQAGAEFVHGANSVFADALREAGFKFQEREWPDWWYFDNEGKLVPDSEVDREVDSVHDLFDKCELKKLRHSLTDVSATDWMKEQGASARMLAVADACYANDYGCSLSQLGLTEMVEESRGWDCGDTYLLADRCFSHVVTKMASGIQVLKSCPVERIEYGSPEQGVTLLCEGGRRLRARRVVVTVPLPILKGGYITFSPALPPAKLDALSRLKMGNVIKLILSFKTRFWPDNMFDLICPGSFVPEMWMIQYQETAPGEGYPNIITGFIAGEKADAVSLMTEAAAIEAFLDQLDQVFAADGNARPATNSLSKGVVCDWGKEKFTRGGYSYPTLGARLGDRDMLAGPVSGTLFFAGEATNTALNPCVQGAMDTGRRAAAQVLASLEGPSSRM